MSVSVPASTGSCKIRLASDGTLEATEHEYGEAQGPSETEVRVFVVYGHAIYARDGVEPILQGVHASPIIVQSSESFIDADIGFQVAVRNLLGV